MNRTRWKLTAGALALSLGGLAAVAGVPSRATPNRGEPPAAPTVKPTPGSRPADTTPPPIAVPVPIPDAVPVVGVPTTPAAPETKFPVVEPLAPTVSTPAEIPPAPKTTEFALPVQFPPTAITPVSAEVPALPTAPAPVPEVKPTPAVEPPAPVVMQPLPTPTPAPLSAPAPAPIPDAVRPAATSTSVATTGIEKKLKVLLHMGDGRPKFEVRDGDEVYLKVACDGVGVQNQTDAAPVMKATGKVSFVTPGGDGTCDELTVVPGSGQVTVTGGVSFRYNWGKVETTVTGDKMTFRLGTAPGMIAPAPTTIPASFERR